MTLHRYLKSILETIQNKQISISIEDAEKICERLEQDSSWDKCGQGYYDIKKQLNSMRGAEDV